MKPNTWVHCYGQTVLQQAEVDEEGPKFWYQEASVGASFDVGKKCSTSIVWEVPHDPNKNYKAGVGPAEGYIFTGPVRFSLVAAGTVFNYAIPPGPQDVMPVCELKAPHDYELQINGNLKVTTTDCIVM